MKTTLAILSLLVGLGFLGQIVSVVSFKFAQRLGLQEGIEATDAVYRRLERNTARWDLVVLWTLPLAAILMLIEHSWWPYASLLAGGICIDAGGREAAKIIGLRAEGVRVGTTSEVRLALSYLASMTILGLALVIHSLTVLT